MRRYRVLAAAMIVWAAGAARAETVTIDTVRVGDPGNAADTRVMTDGTTGYGRVDYAYRIGTYEVTAGQYTVFLNAVAGVDTHGLYNGDMANTTYGSGIGRSGGGTAANPYTYSVAANFALRPVNYVSFWDTLRFANWLHNEQRTGSQDARTTEDGAYTLTAEGIANNTVARNAGWKWAVTSEDEWYKAAYYAGGSTDAAYWMYPTSSNEVPGQDRSDVSGNNANIFVAPYESRFTTPVGDFQNSESPYGTFDQGGNVWEWTEAIINGSNRELRGGSYYIQDTPDYLRADNRHERGSDTTHEHFNLGFRISQAETAAVPLPAVAWMCSVMMAGLTIANRIRRR